jgi:hypothetical protein
MSPFETGGFGGFGNLQTEGIYGKRYNYTIAASGRDVNGWAAGNPARPRHLKKKGPRKGA